MKNVIYISLLLGIYSNSFASDYKVISNNTVMKTLKLSLEREYHNGCKFNSAVRSNQGMKYGMTCTHIDELNGDRSVFLTIDTALDSQHIFNIQFDYAESRGRGANIDLE